MRVNVLATLDTTIALPQWRGGGGVGGGASVVKNPTASEGDSGSIPGPESYMPRSRCITTTEPGL